MKEKKSLLSLLWILLSLNYIYCDVFSLMNPAELKQILTGGAGSIQITQGFLLAFAFIMEIPLVMIVLSKVLSFHLNRWLNIGAPVFMAAIQVWSLFFTGSAPTLHYTFFSIIEIGCCVLIAVLALTWKKPENSAAIEGVENGR